VLEAVTAVQEHRRENSAIKEIREDPQKILVGSLALQATQRVVLARHGV